MLITLFVGQAHAFCGAYVGGADSDLSNGASRMAIVRQGDRTVLTLLNDVQGADTDFGLLIPVPESISADDVTVVDAAILADLDRYSAPRLVEYTCENLYDTGLVATPTTSSSTSSGCGGTTYTSDDVSYESQRTLTGTQFGMDSADVYVKEVFTVGEYDATILRAESEEGLDWWLDRNGFVVDQGLDSVLADYVEEDSWFLALQVTTDVDEEADTGVPAESEETWLSALQITYESQAFSLPIRLGTASSEGEQDLLLFFLTNYIDGQVHVSNYDEATIEDECLVDATGEAFGTWYGDEFPTGATWTVEFGWGAGKCDPCPDDVVTGLSDGMVQGVGFTGGALDAYFTRLHLRYTPDAIDQDLSLYASGITDNVQQRYIVHSRDMESNWPICGEGWAEEPGSCATEIQGRSGDIETSEESATGTGCAALGLTPLMGFALLAAAVRRRYARRA